MEKTDVMIVGGSVAGLMAGVTVKQRYHQEKKVTIARQVSKTPVPCGIPYIYGILGAVEQNLVSDEGFINQGIDMRTEAVTSIDRENKTVALADGTRIAYDKLILATGSQPAMPPIPGIQTGNVFSIKKDPEYLQTIQNVLESSRHVVVIGGGFIGVEMAEQIAKMNLAKCNLGAVTVSLVEMLPYCLMLACEQEFCSDAESELRRLGVNIMTHTQVKAIQGDGKVTGVQLASGETIPADAVVVGIGVTPNIDLARQIGLETDPRKGINVDSYMRTNDPDIFAAGDCAAKFSFFDGQPTGIRLASVACSEGMIAASNLYRPLRQSMGTVGAFGTMVGDIAIGAAGLTTNAATAANIAYVVGEAAFPNRHPGCLPGCITDMKAKLLFNGDTGKIIGGHVRGGQSTADMVNILATAIQSGLTAEDLATMQYATHPLMTASPMRYHVMWAAENATIKLNANRSS
ncbi:pyridine nucleotide-disulfide oxidoreductase [Desulfosarcina ovata subsp. sediminis]|uniref:Pyridine nucleotide-disulfide oxidoreductase n=1 Tax=Desulfosarcina ovata subsp. sediminis TaxID=885957 RepID=A0A5K7ZYR3_9BACT|nr:FAD-dependent oxidoreductase [Desulfosarcina ovata]BBO85230.1 pyridine nucleotide-disulfide oxidoreductase [Desulfosarcina ovata subsp. sediminis]